MNKLDAEELEILQAVESGNVKHAENAVEMQTKHQKYAEAMVTIQSHKYVEGRLSGKNN